MNTWRQKPVTLIIADSGPLISLACADELRLLQSFGRPVVIADVVRQECTRKVSALISPILPRTLDFDIHADVMPMHPATFRYFRRLLTPFRGQSRHLTHLFFPARLLLHAFL